MGTSNYNRFPYGVNVAGMNLLNTYAGNVYWVDSGTGSNGNNGTHRTPLADIDTAVGKCAANNGDIIMVFPGHAETVTTTITCDIAGITIIGLGSGNTAPTLIGPNADATIDVTAADVTIKGLRFEADAGTTQAATQKIYINAADCTVEDCWFQAGQYDDNVIYISTSGDNAKILNCEFHISANGPDTGIYLEGNAGALTGVQVQNCFFNGGSTANSWDEGAIYSSGVHTLCRVEQNRFLYMSAGGGVEFTQAATGIIAHNLFGGGIQDQMLDPGSCYCFENYETDTVDASGMLEPNVTS